MKCDLTNNSWDDCFNCNEKECPDRRGKGCFRFILALLLLFIGLIVWIC
jgi:hypothetical protein